MIWGGALVATVAAGVGTATQGNPVALSISAGGLGLLGYGAWRHGKSFDLLSRSMWIYNKSLSR